MERVLPVGDDPLLFPFPSFEQTGKRTSKEMEAKENAATAT